MYIGMTLGIVLWGLPKTLYTADKEAYPNGEEFIRKQGFSSEDKIVSPFVSYYSVRNITKDCYFTGIYPLTLVPEDIRYVLRAANDFGSQNMDAYLRQCEQKGRKVTLVDRLESPRMELYIIE